MLALSTTMATTGKSLFIDIAAQVVCVENHTLLN